MMPEISNYLSTGMCNFVVMTQNDKIKANQEYISLKKENPLAYCPRLNHFSPLFIDVHTGLGKSYGVKLAISHILDNKIADKCFFITPNISNFTKFDEDSLYYKKTLTLRSIDEQFLDSLRISYNKAKSQNYNFKDFESNFNSLSLASDNEFNQYLKSQLSNIYDKCLTFQDTKCTNKIIAKDKFIKNFYSAFNEYLAYKNLKDQLDKKNKDRLRSDFNKALKIVTNNLVSLFKNFKNSKSKFDEEFDFVADFYPLFRFENYSIFVFTSKKLCLGDADFIVKPDNYPTHLVTLIEFIKREDCVVFIDEADAVAEDIHETLIKNKSSHLQNYIQDFRCLVACIKEYTPSDEFEFSIDFDGKSDYTIKDYFNKILSIYNKYHLSKYSNIDSNANLISFNEKSCNASFLDIKISFVSENGYGKYLCFPYQVLKDLNLFPEDLSHFSKNSLLVVNYKKIELVLEKNKQEEKYALIQNLLKENKIFWFENLSKDILDLFAYSGKYFSKIKEPFLKNYSLKREVDEDSLDPDELLSSILNNLLPNCSKSTNNQLFNYILDFFIQSSSQFSHLHLDYLPRPNFYNFGVHSAIISFPLENSNTLNCEFLKFSFTPERFLYNLCQRPVILISATLNIKTVLSNFNFLDSGLGAEDVFYRNIPGYSIADIDKNLDKNITLLTYEKLYKVYEKKISVDLFNNTVDGDFVALKEVAKKEANENSKLNENVLLQNKFQSYSIEKVIKLLKLFNNKLFIKNPLLETAIAQCCKKNSLFKITDKSNQIHQDKSMYKIIFSLLEFTLNPNCHNGLFFTSKNLNNDDAEQKIKKIFDCLIRLNVISFMPSLDFICSEDLKSERFNSIKKKINKENVKGNKCVVFSAYATCSSGANLQIPLNSRENLNDLIQVAPNMLESDNRNLTYDFDTIYVSPLSYTTPIPSNENKEEMESTEKSNKLISLTYQNNALVNNKELKPSLNYSIVNNYLQDPLFTKIRLDHIYTGKRNGTICDDYCISVHLGVFKVIAQSFGRLFRSNNRFPKLTIFIDEFLHNDLAFCLSDQEDLKEIYCKDPIFAKILALHSEQSEQMSLLSAVNLKTQIPVENFYNNGCATMEFYEQNILTDDLNLKKLMIKFSNSLKSTIIHFPTASKSQFKEFAKKLCFNLNDYDFIFDPKWLYFTIDHKLKFNSYYFDGNSKTIAPNGTKTNVADINTFLKIYKDIECIRKYFILNKIPLEWKAQPYVLAKPFFDMYKGELSERAFLATLLSEDPNLQDLLLTLPDHLYEWMDFYNGTNTFIDVKGWSAIAPSSSQNNLNDFLKKLDKKADYICNSLPDLNGNLKMVIVQPVYPEKYVLKGIDYSSISINKRITQNNHKYTYYFIRQLFKRDLTEKYVKDHKNINFLIDLIKGNYHE